MDKGDTYLAHGLQNGPNDPVVAQGNATVTHAAQHVATAVATAVKNPAGAAETLWNTASGEAERLYAGAQAADAAGTLPEYLGSLAGDGAAQIAALPMQEVKGAELLGGLAHDAEAAGAAGEAPFQTTEPVVVSGRGAPAMGRSYETAIQSLYNKAPLPDREYEAFVDGRWVVGIADDVTVYEGQPIAVEAKFADEWATSLRNPASQDGSRPWAVAEQQAMVQQDVKYAAAFDGGVIYHTNSVDLALHYSKAFQGRGNHKVPFFNHSHNQALR